MSNDILKLQLSIYSFLFNRTPTWCYRQSTKLVVDQPVAGECGRPRKAGQQLTKGVTDTLSCPLKDYIITLNSYNITSSIKWYKVSYGKVLSLSKYYNRCPEVVHIGYSSSETWRQFSMKKKFSQFLGHWTWDCKFMLREIYTKMAKKLVICRCDLGLHETVVLMFLRLS